MFQKFKSSPTGTGRAAPEFCKPGIKHPKEMNFHPKKDINFQRSQKFQDVPTCLLSRWVCCRSRVLHEQTIIVKIGRRRKAKIRCVTEI